jgi:hypothetical protein
MKHSLVLLGAVLIAAGCAAAGALAVGQGVGYLRANIDPGRAGVFVDGKYLGPAANFGRARTYTIASGKHELKLVDPRYGIFSTELDIRPGKVTTLWEGLKPLPPAKGPFGTLRVLSRNKFDAVYINDRFYGHVGEFNNPLQGVLIRPAGTGGHANHQRDPGRIAAG